MSTELAQNQKFCVNCGKQIDAKAEICPHCGVRQPHIAAMGTAKGRNKMAAALLAIFLGGLGVHKFYLGLTNLGIIYFVFCWTGIPLIIGFIEGILLLVMSDAEFDQKYNS